MSDVTDPASELAQIAASLEVSRNENGDVFLSRMFEVELWSTSFIRILACIFERADLAERIISRSSLDQDVKASFRKDVQEFKSAFTGQTLYTSWSVGPNGGMGKVRAGKRFSYLQDTIRKQISYARLSDDEQAEFVVLIDRYLENLEADTASDEIVVQAIRDGLSSFRFQLVHMRWMGAGYALSAFRSLMSTYEDSKRFYGVEEDWTASAIMKELGSITAEVAMKMKFTKDYADVAMWAYGGYKLLGDSNLPALALPYLR